MESVPLEVVKMIVDQLNDDDSSLSAFILHAKEMASTLPLLFILFYFAQPF